MDIFILSGPQGSGKTAAAEKLFTKHVLAYNLHSIQVLPGDTLLIDEVSLKTLGAVLDLVKRVDVVVPKIGIVTLEAGLLPVFKKAFPNSFVTEMKFDN